MNSVPLKRAAEEIFRHTLAAIDIHDALERRLDRRGSVIAAAGADLDLRAYDEIVAIAFGKAAFSMAQALSKILAPEFGVKGIVVGPDAQRRPLAGWEAFSGNHPLPAEASFAAGRAILDRLARCGEKSLVIFLISGGGSSMVESALDPAIKLEDFRSLHAALVGCGAPIEEINVIRKHLSASKGGRLAVAAPRSLRLTYAISDVPQGHESALASGPTLPDPTTVDDAYAIAARHGLLPKFPPAIRAIFEAAKLRETPKPGDATFATNHFYRILGEHELLHAAHHASEGAGFYCMVDQLTDGWPLEKAANHLLEILENLRAENPGKRVALFAGGELSSPVTGNGAGGRNSAFVLTCVPKIAGKKIAVLSAGTDGIDGNSPAAGAVADGETLSRAQAAGLDAQAFLSRSDAYAFFDRLGDAIVTGTTGNNLRDLRILLAE
jgi:hydroxypyruvate reductase